MNILYNEIENGIKIEQNYLKKMVTDGGYYQQREVKKVLPIHREMKNYCLEMSICPILQHHP